MRRSGLTVAFGATAILVGLAWAGFSKAQQPRPAAQPEDRMELRHRMANLRSEVDLKRVEHEAARSHLADVLKRVQRLEFLKTTDALTPIGLASNHYWAISGDEEESDNILKAAAMAGMFGDKEEADKEAKEAKEAIAKDLKKWRDGLRAAVDRSKKEFLEQSATLEEKSLELADLEKQYNESR